MLIESQHSDVLIVTASHGIGVVICYSDDYKTKLSQGKGFSKVS